MIKIRYKSAKYIIPVLIGLYIFFFSGSGYLARKKLVNRVLSLEIEIERLETENKLLRKKIDLLKNDGDYIAEIARQLGYAKKGEKIYRFKESVEPEKKTNSLNSIKKTKFHIIDIYTIISLILFVALVIIALLL